MGDNFKNDTEWNEIEIWHRFHILLLVPIMYALFIWEKKHCFTCIKTCLLGCKICSFVPVRGVHSPIRLIGPLTERMDRTSCVSPNFFRTGLDWTCQDQTKQDQFERSSFSRSIQCGLLQLAYFFGVCWTI